MTFPFRLEIALGCFGLLAFVHPASALDQAMLTRLGGVYGGEFTIDQRAVENDEVVEGPTVDATGGRVVLPRRDGQSIRGTISLGLDLLDFRERVKRIRGRGSSAIYAGRLRIHVRSGDGVPLVGTYSARARIVGDRERLSMRFLVKRPLEGYTPVRTLVMRGKFNTVR